MRSQLGRELVPFAGCWPVYSGWERNPSSRYSPDTEVEIAVAVVLLVPVAAVVAAAAAAVVVVVVVVVAAAAGQSGVDQTLSLQKRQKKSVPEKVGA